MNPNWTRATTAILALLLTSQAAAQISPYVYVKMSLGVPWFLYFVFLACILIPFIILIIVAWRRYLANDGKHDDRFQ